MNLSTFEQYIKSAPENVSEWQCWESTLPTFNSILPILDYANSVKWDRDDWRAIRSFIRHGYLEQCEPSDLVDGVRHVNVFSSNIVELEANRAVSINLSIVRALRSISLCSDMVESLSISHASKLTEIRGNVQKLKFLSLNKCQKLDLDLIFPVLESVRILDLSGNLHLSNIEALRENKNVFALYLTETNVIKCKSTIDVLVSMPRLKKLWVKSTKKELEVLREALPNIVN